MIRLICNVVTFSLSNRHTAECGGQCVRTRDPSAIDRCGAPAARHTGHHFMSGAL